LFMTDRLGQAAAAPACAKGWALQTRVAPAALIGANGMRWGPDGRLYVAQAFGGQVSAVDVANGTADVISPASGSILAPDDLAFDSHGNLFATEVMSARVSAYRANGKVDVIAADVPVANGITVHADRIFMSEFNPEGRILELFADGATPRVIASGVMMPNALCLGPDNCLYFPLVPLNEVWRVPVAGGSPERVAGDFNIPTAVKFDARGRLFVVESGTGAIIHFDIASGRKTEFARVAFGIDNFEFAPDGRMFVSHFTDGSVVEIAADGTKRHAVRGGMLGPFGVTAGLDGTLIAADGMSLAHIGNDGSIDRLAMLLQHGFPGYVRGIAVASDGTYVTSNSAGMVARYRVGEEAVPILEGLDRAMGVAVTANGDVVVCEAGAGRVLSVGSDGASKLLASGLAFPTGVHCNADGSVIVSEAGAGRILHIKHGHVATMLDGLIEPHGVTATGGAVFALDRGTASLHRIADGTSQIVASQLPVGVSSGMKVNTLPGIDLLMPGPLLPFSDIAALADATIAVGGDADGSLVLLGQSLSGPSV
jgi:sugar lactone lactonase YvrE